MHRVGRLQDLAIVIRPGYRFLKPNPKWEALYRDAVAAVARDGGGGEVLGGMTTPDEVITATMGDKD